jgi:hypothetical protein
MKGSGRLDLFDLRRALRRGDTIEEIAAFLGRADDDVSRKAHEIGLLSSVVGPSERGETTR